MKNLLFRFLMCEWSSCVLCVWSKCILCFITVAWRHLMLLFPFDWIKERTNFRFNSIIGYFQICQWAFWSVVAKDGKAFLWFYDVLMYLYTECMVPRFCFAFFFFTFVPFECESISQTEWNNKTTFYNVQQWQR